MELAATIFQSLADETRLRILALLLDGDELCVCDLCAVLQLPQSTVSRHLLHLKNSGWVKDRREGVWSYYALVKQPGPVQQSLLPVLKNVITAGETALADRQRLGDFRRGSNCA
jgi:ArsR family transcriptional regulator, arsenate/arsenite/antimonite-responsive transcriptional repressor